MVTLLDILNIQIEDCLEKSYVAKMELNEVHNQGMGYLNGGATLAFAEMSAGFSSSKLVGDDYIAVGQSVNGNHIKAKECSGTLYAYGELIHCGRTTHIWEIKMIDELNKLISLVVVTNSIIKKREKNDKVSY